MPGWWRRGRMPRGIKISSSFLLIILLFLFPRFEDIPCPPGLPLLGHLPLLLRRENAENMPRFAAELRAEYGDIVR